MSDVTVRQKGKCPLFSPVYLRLDHMTHSNNQFESTTNCFANPNPYLLILKSKLGDRLLRDAIEILLVIPKPYSTIPPSNSVHAQTALKAMLHRRNFNVVGMLHQQCYI